MEGFQCVQNQRDSLHNDPAWTHHLGGFMVVGQLLIVPHCYFQTSVVPPILLPSPWRLIPAFNFAVALPRHSLVIGPVAQTLSFHLTFPIITTGLSGNETVQQHHWLPSFLDLVDPSGLHACFIPTPSSYFISCVLLKGSSSPNLCRHTYLPLTLASKCLAPFNSPPFSSWSGSGSHLDLLYQPGPLGWLSEEILHNTFASWFSTLLFSETPSLIICDQGYGLCALTSKALLEQNAWLVWLVPPHFGGIVTPAGAQCPLPVLMVTLGFSSHSYSPL